MREYSYKCRCGSESVSSLRSKSIYKTHKDPNGEHCPFSVMPRHYKPTPVIFKGTGFYKTDNRQAR